MTKQLKSIQSIYFALVMGVILFAAFALYNVNSKYFAPQFTINQTLIYKMVLVFVILAGIPATISFTQKSINHIDTIDELNAKLTLYTKPFLIRMLVLDLFITISILFYMQTGDYSMGLIGAAVFVIMLLTFPSTKKVAADLKIEEETLLNN